MVQNMPKTLLKRAWALLLALTVGAPPSAAQVVEYYHLDALGSVRAVSNQAGQVIEQRDYLPFGEEWCGTALCAPGVVAAGQPRRFTGKERDAETGLDYFGARYYGARLGRFTTVDPRLDVGVSIVDPQKWNRFAYARNNPLGRVDPDGREDIRAEWEAERARLIALHGEHPLTPEQEAADNKIAGAILVPLLVLAAPAVVEAGAALLPMVKAAATTCLFSLNCQNTIKGGAEALSGAAPGSLGSLPFASGDVITREFKTAKGIVDLAAEAVVQGRGLLLKDIAVYPRGAGSLRLGAAEVLAMREQLANEARALGFEELRITGTRFSGANPGKAVDVTIHLTTQ